MSQYLIVSAVTLSLLSTFLMAAESEEPMETMVVTASRTPVAATQAGSSVTVITGEQLEKRQIASVSELLRDVPGLMVNRSGVLGTQTQIRVRGSEANQVLVFIDGMEANDPAADSAFDFSHLQSTGIERIEVIRGPQSALWGSDALAGVINIITKREKRALNITGFTEGGSFGTVRGGGDIGAASENYHFKFSGSYLTSSGENISRQGNEDDGYENGTLSFSGGFSPLENTSLDVSWRHITATTEFDDIDFLTALPTDTDNETELTQDYGRAQAKLALFDQRWEHIVSAGVTKTDNDNFSGQIETGSTRGEKIKFAYQTNFFLNTPELAQASHIFTFALERDKEKFNQRGIVTAFGDPNQDQEMTANSVVGEYRSHLWERLSLSGSIRHDNNSEFRDATTYRVTSAYTHSETGTGLHMSYGTGIKNPTFTERFGFFAPSFFGNPQLQPEESRGWEIGIDQSLGNEKIHLGMTYFKEQLNDEINGFVFDPVLGSSGGFTARNVAGTSKRNGIEVTAGITFFKDLVLTGNYSYIDSKQPDAMGIQREEIRRPRHLANANLDYVFLNEKANVNVNVNYNGGQKDDWFITFPATRVNLESFVLVNLAGSYQLTDSIAFFGRIENLFDDLYEEVFGYRGNSRAIYAGIKMILPP